MRGSVGAARQQQLASAGGTAPAGAAVQVPRCCKSHCEGHTSIVQCTSSSEVGMDQDVPVFSRRTVLGAASIVPVLFAGQVAATAEPAQAARLQQDPRLKPLQVFWGQLVTYLQQQLSDDFAPNLVFYGPGELLPSGTPSDPAAEYNKKAARACGTLTTGFEQPYAICPGVPGDVADSDVARDCCRHFAFAVPRSRYAFAALDRQTGVVASPRLALAASNTWQGILTHEMGHCIDFYTFPQRYQLPSEQPPKSAAAAAALAAIDASESDAELRADLMANALLVPLLGQKLCYDSRTRVQSLVPLSTACAADMADSSSSSSSSDSSQPLHMQHFPHPPVSA